jgi:hypothetical protein
MTFLILSFTERRLPGNFSVILTVRRRKSITSSRGLRNPANACQEQPGVGLGTKALATKYMMVRVNV